MSLALVHCVRPGVDVELAVDALHASRPPTRLQRLDRPVLVVGDEYRSSRRTTPPSARSSCRSCRLYRSARQGAAPEPLGAGESEESTTIDRGETVTWSPA